ncbi:MAG: aminotransferase class V-fold PLP-dependent enzyme [Bryobacteraceae bacterium]|nr:aminotransferase class V-fold PLP-dependent enzyme [Bryobacteraceae bacterium]
MERTPALTGYHNLTVNRRGEFPVTRRLIYLNHAAVAPLSRRAAEAMKKLADDACEYGSLHYSDWEATYAALRESAARMIGASAAEIAIVKNTSEGISTVALGMDWKPGDKVVAFREEFPANLFPWQRLAAKGVQVEWLSIYDSLEGIDEAARGAKLLAISYVNYLSGFRANLEAIGEICRRRGAFFFVDAIQGLGIFPVDVERMRIDALAADGHKWLLGPEGCGILYLRREWQDRIEPVEFGWTNIAGFNDYACRDMSLRADAGRYECGTLNTIGVYGLRAAFDLLLEVGVETVAETVLGLTGRIAAGAAALGYETAIPHEPETGSGIVSVRKEGLDSGDLVGRLRANGVAASPRQGWLRLSPHFYVTSNEIDRVLGML